MSRPSYEEALSVLRRHLAEHNVRAALKYLNSLTPHRYTGLYLFDDPMLKNKYLVDKRNPDYESVDDVPQTATYCAFTRAQGDILSITDAMGDPRFADHPAREEIRSYCGVPLLDERDDVFGTVCHFDHDVVEISDLNVQLLEALAPLLESTAPQVSKRI